MRKNHPPRAHLVIVAVLLQCCWGCVQRDLAAPGHTTSRDIASASTPPPADDPLWPPHPGAELAAELKAAKLLRRALKSGALRSKGNFAEGDVLDVFAEEGKIGSFEYIEVVLGAMNHPEEPMPLVVLIHGRGGRPVIPAGPYLTEHPLRLFIPRGPDKLDDGFSWLATWTNSGKYDLLARSLSERVDELMPAIAAFCALRPTLGKPVVVGFSQGGIMSFALATRYPEHFAAAFPIAGWLPPRMIPPRSEEGVSYPYIHALHGALDTVVPTEKGRETVRQLRRLGLHVDYTEIPGVGHTVTPEMNALVRSWIRSALSGSWVPAEPADEKERAQPSFSSSSGTGLQSSDSENTGRIL